MPDQVIPDASLLQTCRRVRSRSHQSCASHRKALALQGAIGKVSGLLTSAARKWLRDFLHPHVSAIPKPLCTS
jgi:hypothetical protein